ncbi:MAG: hypothetical protein ACPKQO_05130 [Nitrososphaeraceae archaeon]
MYTQNMNFTLIVSFSFSLFIGLISFETINAETPSTEILVTENITKIKDISPFYEATDNICPISTILQSSPFMIFEDKCIEKATITNVGQVENNITSINTILFDNKTIFGQGYGTISTLDGQKINWTSYDTSILLDTVQGYRGIMYFNSTMDENFTFLNNTVGVYTYDADNIRSIWLLD